jgi:hypothetical protein
MIEPLCPLDELLKDRRAGLSPREQAVDSLSLWERVGVRERSFSRDHPSIIFNARGVASRECVLTLGAKPSP